MELKSNYTVSRNKLSIKQYEVLNDVESWLYNYTFIEIAIENLKDELRVLDTLKGVDTTAEGKRSKISRPVENIQNEKENLQNKIRILELNLNKINKALKSLKEDERYVIQKFYIEDLRYNEFIDGMQCGMSNCKDIKKRAIKKIILAVHGVV